MKIHALNVELNLILCAVIAAVLIPAALYGIIKFLQTHRRPGRFIGDLLRFFLPLLVLAVAVMGAKKLFDSRELVKRSSPERGATLVQVTELKSDDEQVYVRAFGTVRPHRQATLQAQVGGRILEQHPQLTLGGLIPKGSPLIRIEDEDYRIVLAERTAELNRAKTELRLEEGRARVAAKEWERLAGSIPVTEEGRNLALRKPQLAEKRAQIDGIKARMAAARLDISRASIEAPFNALVLEENVEVGELINPRASVARLTCTDDFHVDVSLPLKDLQIIAALLKSEGTVEAVVHQDIRPDLRISFPGRVVRLLGALVPESRMARTLVQVDDPLRLKSEDPSDLPLLLGSYVEVEFKGPVLKDVFRIPRAALRQGDRVWVMNAENRLEVRPAKVVDRLTDTVVLQGGLATGERLVTSALPFAVENMLLEVEGEPRSGNQGPDESDLPSPASTEEDAAK